MNRPRPDPRSREEIATAAAQWVLRRDRGLTAAEQDEFSQWLAADPRHGEALAEHRWGWDELDRLTGLQTSLGAMPDPDLFAPTAKARVRRWWWLAGASSLMVAALVAVMIFSGGRSRERSEAKPVEITAEVAALASPCERRTLEDGSVVDLNRGAAVEVAFTATERRVILMRGEANFTVAKDAARPFVVTAGGVAMRAVGTVFNVRLDGAGVEVVVAEGRVRVDPPGGAAQTDAQVLSVGQSAMVPLAKVVATPHVVMLTDAQLAARLAWQPRLLDFTNAPLSEIVADFNRRNPVQLVVGESALGALRLSAAFRSDNVEGFVRLMESDFGMRAEWRSEREIVLRRAK
jgi:transmembrane sensor